MKQKFKGGTVIQSDIFISHSDTNEWPTMEPTRASLFSDHSAAGKRKGQGRGTAP